MLPGQFQRPPGPICQPCIARRALHSGIDNRARDLFKIRCRWRSFVLRLKINKFHFATEIEIRLDIRADYQSRPTTIRVRRSRVSVDMHTLRSSCSRCSAVHRNILNGRVPQLRGPHGQLFVRGMEIPRIRGLGRSRSSSEHKASDWPNRRRQVPSFSYSASTAAAESQDKARPA